MSAVSYPSSDRTMKRTNSNPQKQVQTSLAKWMHDHPSAVKAAEMALACFGCASFFQGVISFSVPWTVGGILAFSAAYISHKALDVFIPSTFDATQHIFLQGQCDLENRMIHNFNVGVSSDSVNLDYYGDIPVLTVPYGSAPAANGRAHGFLLAEQICNFREKNAFAFHAIARLPYPDDIPNALKKIKEFIPKEYLKEMKGIAKGYNNRRQEGCKIRGSDAKEEPSKALKNSKPLTLDEVLFFNLLADMCHFEYNEMDKTAKHPILDDPMGCTVLFDGNEQTGPYFGCTVDWRTLGIYANYSFILRRKTKSGLKIVETSFPMFVGTLTGMNSSGLSLAMNVCRGETDHINGMPAVFFNRRCLESCRSVEDVEKFVVDNTPLGPYHLSIADEYRAESIHLFQGEGKTHHIRRWDNKNPLITTNLRYTEQGAIRPTMTNSRERLNELDRFFADLKINNLFHNRNPVIAVARALRLPEVNNIRTLHTIHMHPKERKMLFATDNGWASSKGLKIIPSKWLQENSEYNRVCYDASETSPACWPDEEYRILFYNEE